MGLFDKKFCDICGDKIGMLGNRKLEDGNMCKNCAAKLSPFLSGRRHTTLDSIKQHLEYREQNKQVLATVHPTRVIGNDTKVYIDEQSRKFFVTRRSNWIDENPDVMDISQVSLCETNIEEHKTEIYQTTSDGKRESYNPRRYEVEYEFETIIQVNNQWFSEIKFELSSNRRPESMYNDEYRELERMANELKMMLTPNGYGMPMQGGFVQQNMGYQQGGMPQQNMGYQQGGMPQQNMGYQQNGMPQQNMGYQQNGMPQQNMGYQQGNMPQQNMGYQQNGMPQQNMGYQQNGMPQQNMGYQQNNYPQQNMNGGQQGFQPVSPMGWTCQFCGTQNSGKFCAGCGSPSNQ